MINITTLVNKVTGKGAPPESAAKGADAPGFATGSEFAELVRMAAKDGSGAQGAGLKLVVNNATPATAIEAALAAQQGQEGAAIATLQMTASGDDATTKPILTSDDDAGDGDKSDDQAASSDLTGMPAAIALGAFVTASAAQGSAAVQGAATPAASQAAVSGEATPGASAPSILAMPSGLNSQAGDAKTAPHVVLRAAAKAAANEMTADAVTGTSITPAASDEEDATAASFASATRAAAITTPKAISEIAQTGQPLRTIFESLPPVIQSELGTSSVGGVTGPSTGDMLGDQVIDMGVSGQWIDRMAKEIAGLAEGNGHSRFTLNPPHLGRLQIDVWHGEGSTDVRLLAETDEATRRLAEGRPALQADARMAALNLGQITVEKSSTSSSDSGARDQNQAGRDLSGNAQQQNDRGAQAQNEKSEWLARTLRNQTSQPGEAAASASAQRAANGHVRFA